MNRLLFALSGCVLCLGAFAGEVTVSNTFSSGQPAVAADVNQNFTDVKTAVDDNDSRITNLESVVPGKQDRVSGTCGAEESIKTINEDGTVTCEADNDSGGSVTSVTGESGITVTGTATDPVVRPADGFIAVPASTMRINAQASDSCRYSSGDAGLSTFTSQNLCRIAGPVLLPNGAQITQLSCQLSKTNTNIRVTIGVGQKSALNIGSSYIFEVTSAEGLNPSTISSISPLQSAVVDNSVNYYFLEAKATLDALPDSGFFAILGCRIHYVFN